MGPQVVHVLTQKGRGYAPAENDPIKRLHDMGPLAKPGSYTAAFTEVLLKEAEEHPEIVAITAAMPDSTGLLPFGDRYPDRCFDVGIAEQHAVTSAAGMAMGGLRPVVAIYSTFFSACVRPDQPRRRPASAFRSCSASIGPASPVTTAPSHHGVLDMVLFTKVPDMVMFAPSSYQELQVMFHDALEMTSGPVAIRWPKTMARQVGPDEVGHGLRGRKTRTGSDLCIIAVGKLRRSSRGRSGRTGEGRGVSVTVWDARVVKPLDPDMLADAADASLRDHR